MFGKNPLLVRVTAGALLALGLGACADDLDPTDPWEAPASLSQAASTVPAPLTSVAFGAASLELWPFTATDLAGSAADPVNLLFPGGDPRAVRAALMMLGGDRSAYGLPNAPPFNCTWRDAVGANQTAYESEAGWVGSAVQLECGAFDPIRFHIRLFPAGDWTVANAHFEVLIPGTNQHEVLSWELAEQLVTVDMIRSGLLDAAVPVAPAPLGPAPTWRAINPLVYNGLPVPLRGAIGGPLGNVAAPVPIPTDGHATIVNQVVSPEAQPMATQRDFTLTFNQVIPKPFCASGPFDYLLVQGPIEFNQRVVVSASQNYVSQFQAQGNLELIPVNPLVSPPAPVGEPYEARIVEHYRNIVTDKNTLVANFQMRVLLPANAPFRGHLVAHLTVGPGESTSYSLSVECS